METNNFGTQPEIDAALVAKCVPILERHWDELARHINTEHTPEGRRALSHCFYGICMVHGLENGPATAAFRKMRGEAIKARAEN